MEMERDSRSLSKTQKGGSNCYQQRKLSNDYYVSFSDEMPHVDMYAWYLQANSRNFLEFPSSKKKGKVKKCIVYVYSHARAKKMMQHAKTECSISSFPFLSLSNHLIYHVVISPSAFSPPPIRGFYYRIQKIVFLPQESPSKTKVATCLKPSCTTCNC